jgi:class II lanthipeptide synthase
MNATQLHRIVWRATPLWDRLAWLADGMAATDAETVAARTGRWRDVLGGAGILRSRLRGSAMSSARTRRRVLGGEAGRIDLPDWALQLDAVLRAQPKPAARSRGGKLRDRAFDRRAPLPFEDVLVGFVEHARNDLKARAGRRLAVLRLSARIALERQLLAHLTFISSLAIGRDYYIYRLDRAPASAFEAIWQRRAPSTRIYRAYVRHMRRRGLANLFDSHPVLARLLCQAVEQWASAVGEFCSRWMDDCAALEQQFGWNLGDPRGAVVQVRADLSDRHRGGRTVLVCRLRTGKHVVYKPRSVQPERAFYSVIGWLNEQPLSAKLKILQVLERRTHGWMEAVEFEPCRSAAGVSRFYRRAGMLLGVLHLLGATDIHRDNLIAAGDHPAVVDLETILNVDARQQLRQPAAGNRGEPVDLRRSVMRTGMLPFWWTGPDEDESDMSALASDESQPAQLRAFAWKAINTDQMTIAREDSGPPVVLSMMHRVQFKGRRPSALEHGTSLLDGFREVYSYFLRQRKRLLSSSRWLSQFDGLNLRILVRSTLTYTRLQLHTLHPEFLEDGIDRSIEIEWLARPLSPRVRQKGARRLYECERAALERLDIPHFATEEWQGEAVNFADEDMRALFKARDSRVLRRRLCQLSDADCRRQLATIEKALRLRFARGTAASRHIKETKGPLRETVIRDFLKKFGQPEHEVDEMLRAARANQKR